MKPLLLLVFLLASNAEAQNYITVPLTNNAVQVTTNFCNGYPCGLTYWSTVSNSFDVPKNSVAWFVGLHGLGQVQIQIQSPLVGTNVFSSQTAQAAYGGVQAFNPIPGPSKISLWASANAGFFPSQLPGTAPNLVGLAVFRLEKAVVKNLADGP